MLPFAIGPAANAEGRFVHEPVFAGEAIEEDEFWREETHGGLVVRGFNRRVKGRAISARSSLHFSKTYKR